MDRELSYEPLHIQIDMRNRPDLTPHSHDPLIRFWGCLLVTPKGQALRLNMDPLDHHPQAIEHSSQDLPKDLGCECTGWGCPDSCGSVDEPDNNHLLL